MVECEVVDIFFGKKMHQKVWQNPPGAGSIQSFWKKA